MLRPSPGGGLLTQTVVVPLWQAMEPAAFLDSFATYGPATGATLFPVELLSVVLLGAVVVATVRHREPGRLVWVGALLCMVATVLLLPLYFGDANAAFLGRTVDDVAGALAAWHAWNWVRTGLAVVSVVLACAGLGWSGSLASGGGRTAGAGAAHGSQETWPASSA